jgi:predicted DsbA family dithiol-disulfide isomerase
MANTIDSLLFLVKNNIIDEETMTTIIKNMSLEEQKMLICEISDAVSKMAEDFQKLVIPK